MLLWEYSTKLMSELIKASPLLTVLAPRPPSHKLRLSMQKAFQRRQVPLWGQQWKQRRKFSLLLIFF